MTLADFLAASARRRVVYGEWDCCLFVADWIKARTGRDPAAGWRGTYSTEKGAAKLLRRRGGIVRHFALVAAEHGLRPVARAAEGDVGVLSQPAAGGRMELVAGICTGPRWALLLERGIVSGPAAPVASWRVAR